MSISRFLSVPFSFGLALSLVSCAPKDKAVDANRIRYRVEVLAHNIDPEIIPDTFVADFDEDGEVDRVTVTDSTLQIDLTGGGEFLCSVRERGQGSPKICDAKVFSLRQDGKFPSIVLATYDKLPVVQHVVYNDSGRLVHKRLGVFPYIQLITWSAYPMRAGGLDCTWLKSNDLPVCFFASREDGHLGVSRLIELDLNGYQRLASDSTLRSQYSLSMARQCEAFRRFVMDSARVAGISSARDALRGWLGVDSATLNRILLDQLPGHDGSVSDTLLAALDWLSQSSPRERARAYLHMDAEAFDSILAESNVKESDSALDVVLAVGLGRLDHEAVLSHDVTRKYRLPWPTQRGQAPGRPGLDGFFMGDAVFFDFSGDGLLDLVVVGQHSRPFSAIQHPDGYFTNAGYHAVPDEYIQVWAPKVGEDTEVIVPPCVYFSMEKDEARRSDRVECYDHKSYEWYEITLPEGPYWTENEPVMFWDMNDDGMIDFAARREDGSWNLLTFVQE
jgi:hypothetical protein